MTYSTPSSFKSVSFNSKNDVKSIPWLSNFGRYPSNLSFSKIPLTVIVKSERSSDDWDEKTFAGGVDATRLAFFGWNLYENQETFKFC